MNFASENNFKFLDYNDYEIVDKTYQTIKGRRQYSIDGKTVDIGNIDKKEKIAKIIETISCSSENTIVYCGRKSDTESYAKALLQKPGLLSLFNENCELYTPEIYHLFLEHLENTFGNDWIVLNALKGRIGIHHSLIPKYIQKEIISLFNHGALVCLFSTTTITEGVNTTAKNVIITSNKKGIKQLRQFDAKNIAGRAGRFNQHYIGRVIDLDNKFEDIIHGNEETIKHKNYDILSIKTDVDYQITKDRYLSHQDLTEKNNILNKLIQMQIPSSVYNAFRIVGLKDKMQLFDRIRHIDPLKEKLINDIAFNLARSNARRFNWDGFQIVIDIILPIVHEEKLKKLIVTKIGEKQTYSLITALLHYYLSDGFHSMVDYYSEKTNKDTAIRIVADYVYNVFKYHLVKYLGVFDIFYRFFISQKINRLIDDIPGMGLLLQKLEYNALTPNARRLSDYGVPFNIVRHYDTDQPSPIKNFDKYEQSIDADIQRLLIRYNT